MWYVIDKPRLSVEHYNKLKDAGCVIIFKGKYILISHPTKIRK